MAGGAGVSGDFGKLRQLVEGMEQLSSSRFRREMYHQLAEEGLAQTQLSFERSESPYGQRWAPPKRRRGKPLLDTGRLRNSLRVSSTSNGFRVSSNVVYAGIHNYGGAIRQPARVSAHNADTGRYIHKNQRATRQPINWIQQSHRAIRISRTAAYSYNMPRRQFLPDAPNLGPRWSAGFANVLTLMRRAVLGR